MNRILAELKGMKTAWRAAFKSQVEVDRYKEQLLKACVENKVNSVEMIERGLSEARKDESDFFPSIGKFIKWCLPAEKDWEHKRIDAATIEFNKARALPRPRNPDVGRKALDDLKRKLEASNAR